MERKWPEVPLENLKATIQHAFAMGPFGSRIKKENFVDQGVPVIKGANLNGAYLVDEGFDFLSDDNADELIASNATHLDIVVTHRGTIGQVGIIPKTSNYPRYVVSQSQLKLTLDRQKANPYFIYYFLRSYDGQHRLLLNASQVGVPAIAQALTSMKTLRVPLPDIEIQTRIVNILGRLDDKIELNRRMNQTLEAMAEAIFKSWFIAFDPVHAKAEGRDTGLPAQIADLFPSNFVESEMGAIPQGWKTAPIGDAVRCVGGATPKTKNPEYWEGGKHPFVTPKDMSRLSSPIILDSERRITDAGVEQVSSKQLPVGAVLLSSRAPIGYLAITDVPVTVNQGVIAMVCEQTLPNLYVLHWTRANLAGIKSQAGGTTFAEISKRNFRPIPALIPDDHVLEEFKARITPIYDRVAINMRQSETLTRLRDTLLPKLLSGEIDVSDAESTVEEMTA